MNAFGIDVEHPFGTATLEPLRRRLDDSGSKEDVWIPGRVRIFLEGGNVHPGLQDHDIAAFVRAWLTVRQAKQIAEDAVEIRPHSGVSTHLYLMTPNVRDQRRRAVGAPLAEGNLWESLAVPASGVTTSADRCIA